jgi:hypothetical protein
MNNFIILNGNRIDITNIYRYRFEEGSISNYIILYPKNEHDYFSICYENGESFNKDKKLLDMLLLDKRYKLTGIDTPMGIDVEHELSKFLSSDVNINDLFNNTETYSLKQ